jgi:hypothetical protein
MTFQTCHSCGGDLSTIPVKRKLFTQFVMTVVRCRQCGLRTTLLTHRMIVVGKPLRRLPDTSEKRNKMRRSARF